MIIKEIIVVEGKDDTVKVKQAVQAETIETNGSAINQQTLNMIRHAQEKRGVIIFTDPDYPGERIRRIIDEHVPGCKHAFLPKHLALGIRGVGIEHATVEHVRQALEKVHTLRDINAKEQIDWKPLLIKYGLLGGSSAKERRKRLGEKLHIGYANGKQLEKRLSMFEIDKKTFRSVMDDLLKEEKS
ncbi:ribonuclease M5 [Bacillaceae bacterium W0354]